MKLKLFLAVVLLLFYACNTASAQQGNQGEITLTTYYPAPYGEYNQLMAEDVFLDVNDDGGTGVVVGNGAVLGLNDTDASFDERLRITAGNADTLNNNQGASIDLHGNAHANLGDLHLVAGQGRGSVATAGNISFWTGDTGANERMLITPDGNVGIGVNPPTGILEVQGGTAANDTDGTDITISAQDGGALSTETETDGGNIILLPGTREGTGTAGGVGIGTDTPGNALEVAGLINAGLGVNETYTGANPDMGVRFFGRFTAPGNLTAIHPAGRIYGTNMVATGGGWNNQALVLGAASDWAWFQDSLRLLGNGRVLIGTNTAATLLDTSALSVDGDIFSTGNIDCDGDLTVDGTFTSNTSMQAPALRASNSGSAGACAVQLNDGNTGFYRPASNQIGFSCNGNTAMILRSDRIIMLKPVWLGTPPHFHADYVFMPDYELESIDEHAEYMWTNKHLKAIVSASESNGEINLLDDRRGIVEELEKAHIYIEQLNNRIKVLEAKLEKE